MRFGIIARSFCVGTIVVGNVNGCFETANQIMSKQ